MDIYANVKKLEDKLGDLLAERNLVYTFKTSAYPITLAVSQDQDTDAQMDLLAGSDGSVSSSDSVLRLLFKLDALEIQTDSRFVIPDDLLTKIKGLAKKLHYAYLQAYFADMSQNMGVEADDGEEPDFDEFYEDEDEESEEDE